MVERAVNNYYKFFDETLGSTTFLVLIVTLLVFLIGTIIPHANANVEYMKGNIMEVKQLSTSKNIVEIDGIKYELQFLKVQ
jgi:hypothetical protein